MKGIKKTNKIKQNSNREITGLILIIISAFVFLCICIPPMLGVVSEAVRNVIVGFFGLIAYPLFLSLTILGVLFMRGKKVTLEPKYVVLLSGAGIFAVLIAHLATSQGFAGGSFNSYIAGCYSSKLTVGGVLFGLIDYPIYKLVGAILSYVIYAAVFALCGVAFVDMKFFRGNRVLRQQAKTDGFRDYPAGVMEKPVYEEKAPELFVSNILPTDTPKNPFYSESGVSGDVRGNYTEYSKLYDEKPQQAVKSYNYGNVSAKDMMYGDINNVYAAYNVKSDNIKTNTASNAFSGSFIPYSAGTTTKDEAYRSLYGQQKESAYQQPVTHADAYKTLYGDRPQSDNFNAYQPSTAVKSQAVPDIRSEEPLFNSNSYSKSVPAYAPKKVVHMDGRPQKVVHSEPKKYDVIVPKVKNPEERYINNPNPIISGEEKSREIIEEHKRKAVSAAAAASLFPNQFKSKESDAGGFIELSAFYEERKSDPPAPVQAPVSKPEIEFVPEVKEQKGNFFERERNIEKMLNEEKNKASLNVMPEDIFDSHEEEEEYHEEVKPLDFDVRVNYKNKASDDEVHDYTGAYKVLPADEKSFEDRVEELERKKEIESGWMSMKTGRNKNRISDNQIGITDYAAEAAKSVPDQVKRFKNSKYIAPPIDLLLELSESPVISNEELTQKGHKLEETLSDFKIPAQVTCITPGPAVTRYEVQVPGGINLNSIASLNKNIAYSLASKASGIRIEAPIPNKSAVGIEVPNSRIFTVGLKDLMRSAEFNRATSPLTFALGKDISGECVVCDLGKMPHLLIAGATGSGKSACLNALITSFIYKASPDDLRLILIDPKRVEFSSFEGLPHLYIKEIITEPEAAINALGWAIEEMERRYTLFAKNRSKNISDFNASAAVKAGDMPKLPFIVLIVDELADIMLSAKKNAKEVEDRIRALTQKARAAGIHLVIATQRPSVDVITGTIKANLPSRIAFMVTCFADSKTILDGAGAERLLGRGDMLYAPIDSNDPRRIQGAYITESEVTAVVQFAAQNNSSEYDDEASAKIFYKPPEISEQADFSDEDDSDNYDNLLPKALLTIIENGKTAITFLQRKLGVGYARAAKIIDQLEERNFVSAADNSNQREIYITIEKFREIFGENV